MHCEITTQYHFALSVFKKAIRIKQKTVPDSLDLLHTQKRYPQICICSNIISAYIIKSLIFLFINVMS